MSTKSSDKPPVSQVGLSEALSHAPAPSALSPVDTAPAFDPLDVGRYELGEELARGGMGRIVLAEDRRLQRPVVIKEMLAPTPEDARRFAHEALVTARLQHPGIVNVHDAGCNAHGDPLFVMERVRGRDLRAVIQSLDDLEARLATVPVVLDVAEAMAYAHSRRVIHRDLKPANVLVGDFGETVVIDWGLAKILDTPELAGDAGDDADPLTDPQGVLGTPAYMPPEQALGEPIDASADVYALGAILYTVLAGSPPFPGGSLQALAQLVEGPPSPIETLVPELPPALVSVVNKAMARDPARRYPDAGAFAEDLRRFTADQLVGAHHYTTGALAKRWVRRHRGLVVSASVAWVVIVAVLSVSFSRIQRANEALADKNIELDERAVLLAEKNRALQSQGQALASNNERLQDASATLEKQVIALRHEQGKTWVERAGAYLERKNDFFAFFMLARALGLSSDQSLLRPASEAFRDARQQLLQHTRPRLLWQSPVAHHHEAGVIKLARHPEGTLLASAGKDGHVHLWRLDSGARVHSMAAHQGVVYSVAFSPDGSLLASAGEDASVALWRPEDGERVATLAGVHAQDVFDVAFSPDGQTLATVGRDSEVHLWDVKAATVRESLTIPGAPTWFYAVDISPDGRWLAAAAEDHRVYVWSLHERRLAHTLVGHTQRVETLAFGPDGMLLASGSADRRVILWSVSTGQPYHRFDHHKGGVFEVAFSADGKRLATSGADRFVMLWDVENKRRIRVFRGHLNTVFSVLFDDAQGRLYSASDDRSIRAWDLASGDAVGQRRGHWGNVFAVAFSPDGQRVVSAGLDDTLNHWSMDEGRRVASHLANQRLVLDVAFSPDGTQLASAGYDGTIALWTYAEATGWTHASTLSGHRDHVFSLAFSPDGQTLASASWDDTLRLWSLHAAQPTSTVLRGHEGDVMAVAFSPDGATLLSAGRDGMLRAWSKTGVALTSWRAHTDTIWDVTFSPDGQWIASASGDRSVKLWSAHAMADVEPKPLQTFRHDQTPLAVAFSPDARRVVSAGHGRVIRMWSRDSGEMLRVLKGHEDSVWDLDFDPSGERLVSASADQSVKLWDARTSPLLVSHRLGGVVPSLVRLAMGRDHLAMVHGEGDVGVVNTDQWTFEHMSAADFGDVSVEHVWVDQAQGVWIVGGSSGQLVVWSPTRGRVMRLSGHAETITGLAHAPDGRRLASVSYDGTLRVWDLAEGRRVGVFTDRRVALHSVVWSADGSWLSAGGADGVIRVWDASSGMLVHRLKGHEDAVRQLAVSGDVMVSVGAGEFVRVWDLRTGRLRTSFREQDVSLRSVAISHRGQFLAAGGDDGQVRVWEVETSLQVARFLDHDAWVDALAFGPRDKHLLAVDIDGEVRVWHTPQTRDPREILAAYRPYLTISRRGVDVRKIHVSDQLLRDHGPGFLVPPHGVHALPAARREAALMVRCAQWGDQACAYFFAERLLARDPPAAWRLITPLASTLCSYLKRVGREDRHGVCGRAIP